MSVKFYWELAEDDDDDNGFGFDQMIMTSNFHANGFPLNPSLVGRDWDVLVVHEFSFNRPMPPPVIPFKTSASCKNSDKFEFPILFPHVNVTKSAT